MTWNLRDITFWFDSSRKKRHPQQSPDNLLRSKSSWQKTYNERGCNVSALTCGHRGTLPCVSMALLLSFKHGRKTVFKHKTGNHQCIKQPAGVDVMSVCVHRGWLCLCAAGVSLSWGNVMRKAFSRRRVDCWKSQRSPNRCTPFSKSCGCSKVEDDPPPLLPWCGGGLAVWCLTDRLQFPSGV